MKEQKKNKGSVLVAEYAYISQKAQFSLVMWVNFINKVPILKKLNCILFFFEIKS